MFHEVRKIEYESIDGGDKTLKKYDGRWGYFSSSCKNMPLSVWPHGGEPTQEWIADCRDYFTTDDDESKWTKFREDIRSRAVPWLASNHYDDETLMNIEYQYHDKSYD